MHCKLSKPCLKAKSFCGSSNVQLRTACSLSVLGKKSYDFYQKLFKISSGEPCPKLKS